MTENPRQPAARRPWHFWLIGIIALLWSSAGAMDYLLTELRYTPYISQFPPDALAFVESLPAWVVATWAIAVWGEVAGVILLLLGRRLAASVLSVSLAGLVLTMFQNYVLSNGLEVMGDPVSLLFAGLVLVVAIALVAYAFMLSRRGIL